MLAIVLLRFKPIQRIWAVLVILINAASFLFLGTIEGKVILIAWLLAGTTMTLIYQAKGFVRLLGLGHIYWIPEVIWLGYRMTKATPQSFWFRIWIVSVLIINSLSLIIDAIDIVRYARGEREEYYTM